MRTIANKHIRALFFFCIILLIASAYINILSVKNCAALILVYTIIDSQPHVYLTRFSKPTDAISEDIISHHQCKGCPCAILQFTLGCQWRLLKTKMI